MDFPWAIIISLFVVAVAFLIKSLFLTSLEEGSWFKFTIGGFFVLYVVAALGIYFLSPPIEDGNVDLASVFRQFSLVSE